MGLNWRGSPGTIRTCPGMVANCGLASLAKTASWLRRDGSPAARRSRFFSRNGRLTAFCTSLPTASGWWNLERITADGDIENVCQSKAELGMPQWVFGMSSYAFASPERLFAVTSIRAFPLSRQSTQTGKLTPIDCPYTDIQFLQAANGQAVFRGGSPTDVASITKFDLGPASLKHCVGQMIWRFIRSTSRCRARSSFRLKAD